MEHRPTPVINDLFANKAPEPAWNKAIGIIRRTHPDYDAGFVRSIFDDVINLYLGKYPGYCPIATRYHDLPHTLDVFLCAIRLMHGVILSGTPLSHRDITLVIVATLMHDVGYAQLHDGKESGTGAQYTKTHVTRGVEFAKHYLSNRHKHEDIDDDLVPIIYCSDPMLPLSEINFPNEHIQLLGQIVGTADLVGQMADRNYLEKLSYLYEEFTEGQIGNYQSIYDLICKTHEFYSSIKSKLDNDFSGVYRFLVFHFRDTMNSEINYYMESIETNIAYLEKISQAGESGYQSMLRRGGIIKQGKQPISHGTH